MALNPAELAKKDVFDEAVSQIGKNTLSGLLPLWMNNFAENLTEARAGDSLDKLYQRPASERVLVVGRGPSIFKHGHLDLLAKHPFSGEIIASDGSLPLLAERRITPTLSMTVDGNPIIAKWFTGEVANIKVRAVIPLTVHPKTVAQLNSINAKKYWYIPELDQEPLKGVTETLQLMTYSPQNPTGISRHSGAGCAGNAAVLLAASILRAKEIVLIGMDCGYHVDTPLEQCHYHDGMLKSCGYSAETVASLYRVFYAPQTKQWTICDPIFECYRTTFLQLVKALKASNIKVTNSTEGGCLFDAEGWVKHVPFKEYLDSISTR